MVDQAVGVNVPDISAEYRRFIAPVFQTTDWHPCTQVVEQMPKALQAWLSTHVPEDVAFVISVNGQILKSHRVQMTPAEFQPCHAIDAQATSAVTLLPEKKALWIIDWHDDVRCSQVHYRFDVEAHRALQVTWCRLGVGDGTHHARCQWQLAAKAQLTLSLMDHFSSTMQAWFTGTGSVADGARLCVEACRLGALHSHMEWRPNLEEAGHWDFSELSLPNQASEHATWVHVTQPGARSESQSTTRSMVDDQARHKARTWVEMVPGCQDAKAEQTHRHWLLSPSACVESHPHLEVHHDRVACEHGVVVASIDEALMFYMQSRGLSMAQSRALLCQAFIKEALDGWAHQSLVDDMLKTHRHTLSS